MSKNTHNLNAHAWQYILNAVNSEDVDIEAMTDRQKVDFVYSHFADTANHQFNMRKFPVQQDRFADWLAGAPSIFNIDFANHRILEIAIEWGSIPENATEAQEDKILSNWYNYIAAKFFQLKSKLEKYENMPAHLLTVTEAA